jgi:hypothetical protein
MPAWQWQRNIAHGLTAGFDAVSRCAPYTRLAAFHLTTIFLPFKLVLKMSNSMCRPVLNTDLFPKRFARFSDSDPIPGKSNR